MELGHRISPVEVTSSNWVQVWEPDLDSALVAKTVAAALASPRLRAHAALAGDGGWGRTLIALTSGSYVPPHLHPVSADASGSCERLVSVRGRCAVLLFDSNGEFHVVHLAPEAASGVEVRPGVSDASHAELPPTVKAIAIGNGVAHSLLALDEIAVVCESKPAADPAMQQKQFLPQFPAEGDAAVAETLRAWRRRIVPSALV